MSMDIPERFFVSTGKQLQAGDKTLAMARKFTGLSPDKKAIESIKNWTNYKDYEPDILNNEPLFGFEVVGLVERYRTKNKLFEVVDPRGFKLQISCENLLDLISEETIKNGVIQTECVWGFSGSVHLMGIHGETYKRAMNTKSVKESKKKVTGSKLVVGEVYDKADYGMTRPAIYLGRASGKSLSTTQSGYGPSVTNEEEFEVHNCYLFALVSEMDLSDKNFKPSSYGVSISMTKTCPKVFESPLTTIHDTQTIKDWIRSRVDRYIPDCLKPKGRTWRTNTKLVYLKAPSIGLDAQY